MTGILLSSRLPDHADLPILATVVFAGPTPDMIHVMVPDCLLPPVGSEVRIDLRHFITLQLGLATDISKVYGGVRLKPAFIITITYYVLGYQHSLWWG